MVKVLPKLVLIALLIPAAQAAAAGRVYTWKDSQGNIHYSDQPTANSHPVVPKAPGSSDDAAESKPAPVQTAAAKSADDCQQKKDKVTAYRSAGKITETNAFGETREFSDEQKQKLIEVTEKAAQEACSTR